MTAAQLPRATIASRARRLPDGVRGARAAVTIAFALVVSAVGACGRERTTDPTAGARATSVAVSLPASVFRVGDTVHANVSAFDSIGRVLRPRSPKWESSNAVVASVSPNGDVAGVSPGLATISAVIDGTRGTFDVQVVRPLAVSVSVTPDTVAIPASVVVDLAASARDVAGQPILGIAPLWTTSAPDVAIVTANGRVTAVAPGRAEIAATVDGITGRAIVIVTRLSNVRPSSVSPAVVAPGATVTINGSGFSTNRTANIVTVGGVVATVRTATATQLSVTLATTGYGCEPTRDVPVLVSVGGESGTAPVTLQVATQRTLAPGEALVVSDPVQARCNEIAPASGRYIVAVYNPSASPAAVPLTLRGARGETTAAALSALRRASGIRPGSEPTGSALPGTAVPLHASVLTLSRGVSRVVTSPAAPAVHALARSAAAAPGDTQTFHLLNAAARTCNDASGDVRGRVVFVGRRVAVLEDIAAPLAGTMDDDYRRIGQEFDDVTYPLIEATFGSPLAVDARLARAGRVTLLFTRLVNERAGVLGISLSCDLVPASAARASNEQSVVYLAVPTSAASGIGDGRATGTRDAWRRRIRAIAAHESKHVASYAERLARAAPFEELWLEEGSALIAEELFARAVRSIPLRTNTTYRESLLCELRPNDPGCMEVPIAFSDHFARLYATLVDPSALTPLVTDPTLDPGAAFYGSAWWLLRWAADNFAPTDAAFFRALVAGPQIGIDNLAARVGRPFADLLGEWWLATAVDDLAGFQPQRASLTEPSWNLRDAFAGAQTSGDPRFARAFPLAPRPGPFGDFAFDVVPGVRGGGAAFFELAGPPAARQLLEIRSIGAAAAPAPALGIAIVRVQ